MNRLVLISPLVLSFALACGGGDKPAESPSDTTSSPHTAMTTTVPAPTASAVDKTEDHGPPPAPATAPAPMFSDAQIASITDAVNAGEVDQGKLALTKATDARVKQFAQMMVTHHTEAKTKQAQLLVKLGTTPEATSTSQGMTKTGTDVLEALKAKRGAEFDRAYIDLQVKEHRDVLALLDDQLLSAAVNADFKKGLGDVRTRVAEHLHAAEALQAALAGSATPKSTK